MWGGDGTVKVGTVKAIRISRGYSQKQASEVAEISCTSYGKKERAEVQFVGDELGKLAKAWNVSTDTFYKEL